jgi:hypothetical protein
VNDAIEALKARSSSSLLGLSFLIEAPLTARAASDQEITEALELGRAQFAQLNALLKRALDSQDREVFTETEREWGRMFEHQYLSEEDEPFNDLSGEAAVKSAVIRQLTRYRETLWLGLAMWAAHLLEKRDGEQPQNMWVDALRILSQRFPSIERLLATYERASEGEEQERLPWSNWFLSELPQREAHFLPTQAELLFTTILLATMLIGPEPPVLAPAPWIRWRGDEVDGALRRLDEQAAIWSFLILVPTLDTGLRPPPPDSLEWWHDRVATARAMFTRLKEDTDADERSKLRVAPPDPQRVNTFRSNVLASTRRARLVRDIFRLHGSLEHLDAPPDGHVALASRTWLPKSYFTGDSRVVGLEWVAGDLSRVTANSEIEALLKVLDGIVRTSDGALLDTVKAAIRNLRHNGRRPSLIVIPIGWDLRRALELPLRGASVTHDLIPLGRSGDFEGVIDDVPVIDFPHVPKDILWVVDLAMAATMREWPSDEDSGIRFDLRDFDEQRARALLAEHPEVRAEGATEIEAVRSLQEKLLLTLTLCWDIVRSEAGTAIQIAVPTELQRS